MTQVFQKNLKNIKNFKNSNSKGFTLLEILIVIGILGGIMTLILPNILSRFEASKGKSTKLALGQIVSAIALYNSDCGKNPSALKFLKENDPDCPNWSQPYLKTIPKDGWNREFVYENNAETGNYSLKSLGKDGKEGGTESNKDIDAEDQQ